MAEPGQVRSAHVVTGGRVVHAAEPGEVFELRGTPYRSYHLACGATSDWAYPEGSPPPGGQVTCKRCVRVLTSAERALAAITTTERPGDER